MNVISQVFMLFLVCVILLSVTTVSAFYAECQQKRISIDGYIWTKSKFLGLSVGVHMIGQSVISVLDYEEDYVLNFPNGYGRLAVVHFLFYYNVKYVACLLLIIKSSSRLCR